MSDQKKTLVQLAAGLGVTALTTAAGVPFVAPALVMSFPAIAVESDRRRSLALTAVETLSGEGREELAARIAEDPASVNLLMRLLYQAGNNGHDDILKMMALAMLRGSRASAEDQPQDLFREESLLEALGDLNPFHVEILQIIRENPLIDNVALAAAVPEREDLVPFHVLRLVSLALVENPYGRWAGDNGEQEFYELSALGGAVLEGAATVAAKMP